MTAHFDGRQWAASGKNIPTSELTTSGSRVGGYQGTGEHGCQGHSSKHMFSAFKYSNAGGIGVISGHLHMVRICESGFVMRRAPRGPTTVDSYGPVPGNKYGAVRPIMITKNTNTVNVKVWSKMCEIRAECLRARESVWKAVFG